MAKFDPQPTLNPWTDRHQIWNTWLRRGYLLPKKFGLNPKRGFCPHIREIYAPNLRMFTSFFSFHHSPQRRARLINFRALYVIRRGSAQGSAFWGW